MYGLEDRQTTPAPRLLLIQEQEADRRLAKVVLSHSFPASQLTEVSDGAEIFTSLEAEPYDVIITQLGMERAHWTFLLGAIRALQPSARILVFAEADDEAEARQALKAGASSYVLKSSQGFLDLATAVSASVEPEAQPEPGLQPLAPRPAAPRVEPERVESQASEPQPTELQPMAPQPIEPAAIVPNLTEPSQAAPPPIEPRPVEPAPIEPAPQQSHATDTEEDLFAPPEKASSTAMAILKELRTPLTVLLALITLLFFISRLSPSDAGSEVTDSASATSQPPAAEEPDPQPRGPQPPASLAAPPTPSTPSPATATPPTTSTPAASLPAAPPDTFELPPVEPAVPITLQLRAEDEVWVALTIDGAQVIDAILQEGQTYSFQGEQSADLQVGNAAGLTVIWNEQDLGVLGRQGQVRRLQFSPDEVRPGPPAG